MIKVKYWDAPATNIPKTLTKRRKPFCHWPYPQYFFDKTKTKKTEKALINNHLNFTNNFNKKILWLENDLTSFDDKDICRNTLCFDVRSFYESDVL